MIVSVAKAQVGRVVEVLMYALSQVMFIAWFLADISIRPIPPSSLGCWRHLRLIGGVRVSFHKNLLISLFRAASIFLGIPWAFVKNCVIPPTNICVISHFPSSDGLPLFQVCRF